jgi:hypothetical protein
VPILAANYWQNNAALIADCARLGYLRDTDHVLDPTYGKGNWWREFRPEKLTAHDITLDGIDFRALPYEDSTFDAAVFDPPYVCAGGRATTTIPEFHSAYGMTDAPRTPLALQNMNNAGLREVMRVVKPRAKVLVKCQDYVSSGKLWLGTHWTLTYALSIGFECWDRLEHIGSPRPQPERERQYHARRNLSTLFVFVAPKGW